MAHLQFDTYGNLKQKEMFRVLLDNSNGITDVGYGGGAGGGKSYGGVAWQWMMRNKYPGTRGFFGRKELKRLKQTTLATYFKFCDDYNIPESQRGIYNAQSSEINFNNGSQILLLDLSHMPSDPLYTRFGSLELTDGFADEIAEIENQCLMILKTRIGRQKNDEYGLLPKFLGTFNPDKGHVYRDYYKASKEGRLPDYRVFIPALATDNKKLPKAYIDQLKKADDVTKQRLLYGNFEYDDTPGRLFDYNKILELTNYKIPYKKVKFITGDIARKGKDKAVIFVWEGYNVVDYFIFEKSTTIQISEKIRELQEKHGVENQMTIVDEDGVGGGVVDELGCKGFINNSSPKSNGGAKRVEFLRRNYFNLKTQCYFLLAKIVNDNLMYVKIEEQDKLNEELDVVCQVDLDKDGKIRITSKEDIKGKLGRSPDYADTLMMRMYFDLIFLGVENEYEEEYTNPQRAVVYYGMTLEEAMNDMDNEDF